MNIVKIVSSALAFSLLLAFIASVMVLPASTVAVPQQENTAANEMWWVTTDRLHRRTCPSMDCGVVGMFFFREGVPVYEHRDGWVRVSIYYDASCMTVPQLRGERSEYVDSGNNLCHPNNGIVNGQFAEWVEQASLSPIQPEDPAAGTTGDEALVAGSDDYRIYKDAFAKAARSLIDSGQCREQDFRDWGGWGKSVTGYPGQPVYFIQCDSSRGYNRFYLNAETGRIFR